MPRCGHLDPKFCCQVPEEDICKSIAPNARTVVKARVHAVHYAQSFSGHDRQLAGWAHAHGAAYHKREVCLGSMLLCQVQVVHRQILAEVNARIHECSAALAKAAGGPGCCAPNGERAQVLSLAVRAPLDVFAPVELCKVLQRHQPALEVQGVQVGAGAELEHLALHELCNAHVREGGHGCRPIEGVVRDAPGGQASPHAVRAAIVRNARGSRDASTRVHHCMPGLTQQLCALLCELPCDPWLLGPLGHYLTAQTC
mmetsp:Transcript_62264/g.144877  ORF Transcript_62264/g.144877 Transcript_62264/m.144877 type:complete len:256 (+) Transcript_62264:224-991(+)